MTTLQVVGTLAYCVLCFLLGFCTCAWLTVGGEDDPEDDDAAIDAVDRLRRRGW